MPWLKSCCCGCSLRTGTLFVGVWGIVGAVLGIVLLATTQTKFKNMEYLDLDQSTVRIILYINLAMTIVISALLIYGVLKKSRFMMLAHIVLFVAGTVGLLLSTIITSVHSFIDGQAVIGSIILVGGIIFTFVCVYFCCVVYSFYQQLKEEGKRGVYGRAPQYQYQPS